MSRSAPALATGLLCLSLLGCALAGGSRAPATYDLVAPRSFAGSAKTAPSLSTESSLLDGSTPSHVRAAAQVAERIVNAVAAALAQQDTKPNTPKQ